MPIELEKRTAQLVNLSANVELHGEDPQPVAYLKLAFGLTIEDLVLFSPTIRGAMFDNARTAAATRQGVERPVRLRGQDCRRDAHDSSRHRREERHQTAGLRGR